MATDLTPDQQAALQAPFDPALIDYRPQGKSFTRNGELQGRVVAYVDARAVAARLDAIVGPLNWAYDYDPLIVGPGKAKGSWHDEVLVVKGHLTILGVTKHDLGDSGDSGTEPSKSAVSDGLKRAAVLWGIGRDLYDLPVEYVKAEGDDFNWRPVKGELERLRAKLRGHAPRPAAAPVEVEPAAPRRDPQIKAAMKRYADAAKEAGHATPAAQRTWAEAHSAGRPLEALSVADWDVLAGSVMRDFMDGPTRTWDHAPMVDAEQGETP